MSHGSERPPISTGSESSSSRTTSTALFQSPGFTVQLPCWFQRSGTARIMRLACEQGAYHELWRLQSITPGRIPHRV
eukprot:3280348-Prymnesium_polylepis.1